jgi:hypothetical protein
MSCFSSKQCIGYKNPLLLYFGLLHLLKMKLKQRRWFMVFAKKDLAWRGIKVTTQSEPPIKAYKTDDFEGDSMRRWREKIPSIFEDRFTFSVSFFGVPYGMRSPDREGAYQQPNAQSINRRRRYSKVVSSQLKIESS